MANRNWANGRAFYAMHVKPVVIDCKFTVAVADTGGLGITSLKGPCVQNVFMHTSATPGAGNSNPATPNVTVTNPNPASGTILVQLSDAYSNFFNFKWSITSPASGSDVKIDNSAMTTGVAYQITTLGDATAAKWRAIGVPAGVTPAVGVSFIAASNGGAGNTLTSKVQASATSGSGVAQIEKYGGLTFNPDPTANQGYGSTFIFQCYDYAGAKVAPADGSVIHIEMYLSDSSVQIGGE